MRTIKFRAWDKVNKVWYKSYATTNALNLRDSNIIFMQYTGLKDKNGVEIYEGDIVKYNKMIQGATPVWSNPVVVEWRSDKAKFDFHDDYSDGWSFNGFIYIDYEVIGNIYENKELLK